MACKQHAHVLDPQLNFFQTFWLDYSNFRRTSGLAKFTRKVENSTKLWQSFWIVAKIWLKWSSGRKWLNVKTMKMITENLNVKCLLWRLPVWFCFIKHTLLFIYMLLYRVQQKSNPLRFFAVFSAIAWNLKAKFYRHKSSFYIHIKVLSSYN